MSQAKQMLQEMTDTYRHKVGDGEPFVVELEIQPNEFLGHLAVGQEEEIALKEGHHPQARFTVTMSFETLQQIYQGEMTAFTGTGRERLSDHPPVDFKLGPGVAFSQSLYAQMIEFVQRFFWHSDPERILLGEEHARFVHGGHAIPLFYQPGCRSAWYLVKKGEQINKSGDSNPFPQGFVFISGEGKAEIAGKVLPVRAGEAYYIPPGASHMVWTESDAPLVMLWLAWGEGA